MKQEFEPYDNLIMKQDIEWHEICKCKCRLDANIRIMINAGVNAKN